MIIYSQRVSARGKTYKETIDALIPIDQDEIDIWFKRVDDEFKDVRNLDEYNLISMNLDKEIKNIDYPFFNFSICTINHFEFSNKEKILQIIKKKTEEIFNDYFVIIVEKNRLDYIEFQLIISRINAKTKYTSYKDINGYGFQIETILMKEFNMFNVKIWDDLYNKKHLSSLVRYDSIFSNEKFIRNKDEIRRNYKLTDLTKFSFSDAQFLLDFVSDCSYSSDSIVIISKSKEDTRYKLHVPDKFVGENFERYYLACGDMLLLKILQNRVEQIKKIYCYTWLAKDYQDMKEKVSLLTKWDIIRLFKQKSFQKNLEAYNRTNSQVLVHSQNDELLIEMILDNESFYKFTTNDILQERKYFNPIKEDLII